MFVFFFSAFSCSGQHESLTHEGLASFFSANELSGVVLVQKEGKNIVEFGYGMANLEGNVPNNINTTFNIGSITKAFTATLTAQLLEDRVIKTDQQVGTILPEFFDNNEVEKLTIYQLLTHTSGLGNYLLDPEYQDSFFKYRKLADYKPILKRSKIDFEPGSSFQYSNSGMLLLGLILEKITGITYEELLITKICKPIGLSNTHLYHTDDVIPNRAIGYVVDSVRGKVAGTFMHSVRGTSAGGSYSSASDLAKFYNGLLNSKLVSKQTFTKMTMPHVKNTDSRNPNRYTGYALSVDKSDGSFGHSGGGAGGISNYTSYFPKEDILIVILMNQGSSQTVRNHVLKSLGLWEE